MIFHPDDLERLLPTHGKRPLDFEVTTVGQRICGLFSGTQRKINCIRDVVSGTVPFDHNGRRRIAKARDSLLFFAGLLADARRDDPRSMTDLRWEESFWLGSLLRMCKAYSRKAIVFNRGNMQDLPQVDYHREGCALLGLSGGETVDEVLNAIRAEFYPYIEPHITTPAAQETEAVERSDTSECRPGMGHKQKKQYHLTFSEFQAIKKLAKSSDLRIAAGRLSGYKRRGDVAGFLNTLYSMRSGRLSTRGSAKNLNGGRQKFGSLGEKVMSSVLLGSASILEATFKLHQFMATGEMP